MITLLFSERLLVTSRKSLERLRVITVQVFTFVGLTVTNTPIAITWPMGAASLILLVTTQAIDSQANLAVACDLCVDFDPSRNLQARFSM